MSESAGPEVSQTLDRGLQILLLLGSAEGQSGLTVSQLSARLGVGRAVVYRLLTTLLARDFATRSPDGRVRLGAAVTRLSVAVRPVLAELARPVLAELADRTGATAHLTIADGQQALALVVVEPTWTSLHVAYRVGSRHPLALGAAGRAILAGRTGRPEVVPTEGELQQGAHGVAAPVLGVPGLEASVGVVAMQPLTDDAVAAAVLAAAAEVARALVGPTTWSG